MLATVRGETLCGLGGEGARGREVQHRQRGCVTSVQASGVWRSFRARAACSAWPALVASRWPTMGWPSRARSPMASSTLWRTNSSSKRSLLLSTPVSPMTTAFSRLPPRARPFRRSVSTSRRNPNVRAPDDRLHEGLAGHAHGDGLVAQQRVVEADRVGDAEMVRRGDADGLPAAHDLHRTQDLQVAARPRAGASAPPRG